MLSLASLRNPLTRRQAHDRLTEWLTSLGFNTDAWPQGSMPYTFLQFLAMMWSDTTEVVKALAEFGFNSYATGDGLREFSKSRYDQDKEQARQTVGTIRLTSTASVPYTIQPRELIAATDEGIQYRNTTGGVLAAGSTSAPKTLDLTFEAVVAGESGNVTESTITRLLTPLAGVTCSNSVGNPWYSTAGRDEESDASLRRRNATKWATMTVELVAESYEHIARLNGAAKVLVDDNNPRGPGTLDVYVSADRTKLGPADMEALQSDFARRALQTQAEWHETWPAGNLSRVATKHPVTQALDVTAVLYHDGSSDDATIIANAEQAMRDFLNVTPIGGWDYSPGPANIIKWPDLVEVLRGVDGVLSVSLTTPASDIAVGSTSLVTEGAFSLSAVAVEAA